MRTPIFIALGMVLALASASAFVSAPAYASDLQSCEGKAVTAKGKTLFYGDVEFKAQLVDGEYHLVDCARKIFTFDLNENTDFKKAQHFKSKDGVFKDRSAVTAHWAVGKLYDFYENTFGWKGYSNQGKPLSQYVHYGQSWFNASFDKGDVKYGDGGYYNSNPIVSVAYIGHEVTHGVTLHASGLIYEGESAALNESFSDIFAKVFEHSVLPERKNDWAVFTDIYRDNGMSTRSMSKPDTQGITSDYVALKILKKRAAKGEKTVLQPGFTNYLQAGWTGDDASVYAKAGVQNFWFYLLANGGKTKDLLGNDYDLSGIGTDKAAQIAWRNLTVYLKPDADFLDARYGSEQAAIDLYGNGSKEHLAVTQAWKAVSVVPANYKRVPHPDRNVVSIKVVQDGIAYDASMGVNFPRSGLSAHAPNDWRLQSSSAVETYSEFVSYQNWNAANGRTYEIRFTAAGGKALFNDASGSKKVKLVPFEVWDIGRSATDTSDDVRFIPIVFDVDKDGKFGLWSVDKSNENYSKDHPVLPGANDFWTDMIHIAAPKNNKAGQAGYNAFVKKGGKAIGDKHMNWLAFIRPETAAFGADAPATGQIFRIELSKKDGASSKQKPVPVALNQ